MRAWPTRAIVIGSLCVVSSSLGDDFVGRGATFGLRILVEGAQFELKLSYRGVQ